MRKAGLPRNGQRSAELEGAGQEAPGWRWFWSLVLLLGLGLPLSLVWLRTPWGVSAWELSCKLFLIGLWAGLTAASERAWGPLGFHEPIVAASLTGLLLGYPAEGVWIGCLLQLLWPGLVPMGGSRQPDTGLAAIVACAWFCLLPAGAGAARLAVALPAGLVAATVGGRLERWLRARNEAREERLYISCAAAASESAAGHDGLGQPGRQRVARALAAGSAEAIGRGVIGSGLLLSLPVLLAVRGWQIGWFDLAVWSPWPWPGAGSAAMAAPWCSGWPLLFFAVGGYCAITVGRARRAWQAGVAPVRGGRSDRSEDARCERRVASPGAAGQTPTPPGIGERIGWLALQAAFSARHLQRTGFLYLWKLRRELTPLKENPAAIDLERELLGGAPINTHPILAPALLGGLERVCRDAGGDSVARPPIRLLSVGGPLLSQWGDRAVWGGLRPAAALLCLAWLPLAPLPIVGLYLTVLLAAQWTVRGRLFGWGLRAGWALPQGLQSRGARWLAVWPARLLPFLALGAGASLVLWLAGAALPGLCRPGHWVSGGIWFILGLFAARFIGARPLRWGWTGALAGALGALLAGA